MNIINKIFRKLILFNSGVLPITIQDIMSIKDKILDFFYKVFGIYDKNATLATEGLAENYPTETYQDLTENYLKEGSTERKEVKAQNDIIYPIFKHLEVIDEQEEANLVRIEIPLEISSETVNTINPELEYEMSSKLKNRRYKRF